MVTIKPIKLLGFTVAARKMHDVGVSNFSKV